MGKAYVDNLKNPTSAQIIVGDFMYFSGEVNERLLMNLKDVQHLNEVILISGNQKWNNTIEKIYRERAKRHIRYSTKKDVETFDKRKLKDMTSTLPKEYDFKMIDEKIYHEILQLDWARDLCIHYKNYLDFSKNGLGCVILKESKIVSGASSYSYYPQGIEIEIDTLQEERRKGLARICGAKLILECLDRGLYPNWDAHTKESLLLAEQLGYQFNKEYPVYIVSIK